MAVALGVLQFAGRKPSGNADGNGTEKALDQGHVDIYSQLAGLITLHDANGNVVSVMGRDADAYRKRLGIARFSAFGELVHVSDRIAFLSAIDGMRQGAETSSVSVRLESRGAAREAGQFLHVRMHMTATRDDKGTFTGFLVQSVENAEEAAASVELENARADAAGANEAKSRFLAAVSHELRTPLNAILGFSDILAGEYFGKLENDRQREYVSLINQSGIHLLAVVNTMLDMSKIEAGHYELMVEPLDIERELKACHGMMELQAEQKGVTLNCRAERGIEEVIADRRAIKQVLINLVGNAIKFTDKGGVVTVDVALRGENFEISVADTGIGIPAEKLELLGKPFMQVDNEYTRKFEGTGLGLALVKGLVALHDGEFSIASTQGEGTTITVTIPADGSGAARVEEAGRTQNRVEFPPRLTTASASMIDRDEMNEQAKAKSA